MPQWKSEVIYMFKMVRYIKIFIKFPSNISAFWDDNHYIMHVDPHARGRFQVWQNLEARGKYFKRGTNILLCTVVGAFYDLVSTMTKEKVMDELYEVLKEMYGDSAVRPEDILVPDHHILPISRHFLHEEMYRVFLYDDTVVVLGGEENKNPMNANDKSYLIDGK